MPPSLTPSARPEHSARPRPLPESSTPRRAVLAPTLDVADPRPGCARPRVEGKFLAAAGQRLWVRGVTYGTFAPTAASLGGRRSPEDPRLPEPPSVHRDFATMAAQGINAVRTYTAPPRWFLDAAFNHGLWVMAGLPWEQHVAFLDGRSRPASIVDRVRARVAECAGHPALLCWAIGNEIPAPIVRWHGRRRIERFLERLCDAARAEDPHALLTYANYPSTEYLRLPFLDLLSFNVYLEERERLERYLARLHNLAHELPLVLGELGLDSRRHGLEAQADAVGSQLEVAFGSGCAGAFVFAWTDEWYRGEHAVDDWDFGLTDRARRPKPALAAARRAFASVPVTPPDPPPRVSVVVCTHNGAATLRDCLRALCALRYPDYEVIVVDDGSTDASARIATAFGVKLICTPNKGLSAARNTGLKMATGEIVAYIDDDARADPEWLTYLALTFAHSDHAGVGGPNVPPADDGAFAGCVANAPGGPVHVLLSDTIAEHIPGCNMAYRRDALLAIGGFDERFRVAGDDVDVCWRLQQRGHTLGFHPAALVWHHRRASLRGFWRQQRGYGKAEALLERKWPEKYDLRGHLTWSGRLYGRGIGCRMRSRIYHGTWGTGAFQPEVTEPYGRLTQIAATPEWYLVIAASAALAALGLLWAPLLLAGPLAVLATAMSIRHALEGAWHARLEHHACTRARAIALRGVVVFLHLLQPAARLAGRLGHGLVPWRRPVAAGYALPVPRVRERWYEAWASTEARLRQLDATLRRSGARVRHGGPFDRWDLQVEGGALGAVRVRTTLEEHGGGCQLMRCALRPRLSRFAVVAAIGLGALAIAALLAGRPGAGYVLLTLLVLVCVAAVVECGLAMGSAGAALDGTEEAR